MKEKTCLIITGPTAVGKTSVAIEVASHLKTAIISADSRQCFRELDIGVAKPSDSQLRQVKHYFINSHAITDEVNAAVFEQYALGAVEEIFQHHDIAVMTGGTGLYIKAFCNGIDDIPAVNEATRSSLQAKYEKEGMDWLQKEVQEKDPEYYATGEIQNPQRLLRALEVKLSTGHSIRSFQRGKPVPRNFNIVKIGLNLPREVLYQNINHRVDDMMQKGLPEEVRSLVPCRRLNALQTVGYTELFDYWDGLISLEQAVTLIKQNTRHYAKRQLTWFGRDESIHWFSPLDPNQLISQLPDLV